MGRLLRVGSKAGGQRRRGLCGVVRLWRLARGLARGVAACVASCVCGALTCTASKLAVTTTPRTTQGSARRTSVRNWSHADGVAYAVVTGASYAGFGTRFASQIPSSAASQSEGSGTFGSEMKRGRPDASNGGGSEASASAAARFAAQQASPARAAALMASSSHARSIGKK